MPFYKHCHLLLSCSVGIGPMLQLTWLYLLIIYFEMEVEYHLSVSCVGLMCRVWLNDLEAVA